MIFVERGPLGLAAQCPTHAGHVEPLVEHMVAQLKPASDQDRLCFPLPCCQLHGDRQIVGNLYILETLIDQIPPGRPVTNGGRMADAGGGVPEHGGVQGDRVPRSVSIATIDKDLRPGAHGDFGIESRVLTAPVTDCEGSVRNVQEGKSTSGGSV